MEPLRDVDGGRLKVTGETTLRGETVYDLVPTQGPPQGLELHWYVSKDGRLRRVVTSAGDSSLTTDVDSYEVLAPTQANRGLLRLP